MATAWFISDVHLKDINERNGVLLKGFLKALLSMQQSPQNENSESWLFILGDLFDVWVGDHDYYLESFGEIIDPLIELTRCGVKVVYFEGNHDVHIKRFWEDRYGISCFDQGHNFIIDGLTLRCEHGDYINPNDKTYLKYLEIIHRNDVKFIAQQIPPQVFEFVGKAASRLSRKRTSQYRKNNQEELRQMVRDYARCTYLQGAFDFLFTGHIHIKDEWSFQVNNKKITSVNLGSWLEEPFVYCLKNGKGQFHKIQELLKKNY